MNPRITIDEWLCIGHGSIVRWNGRERTALIGPADYRDDRLPERRAIVFPILRRSWTNRATTVYGWHDAKYFCEFTGRVSKSLISKAELSRLLDMEFTPSKELARERDREMESQERSAALRCQKHWREAVNRTINALRWASI